MNGSGATYDGYPIPVGDKQQIIGITCHFATVFWLLADLHGTPPPLDHAALGSPGPHLRQMMAKGGLRKVGPKPVSFTAGSVFVFATNGNEQHSGIALSQQKVAGYNQNAWFAGGLTNLYTEHRIDSLPWAGPPAKNLIQRSAGNNYELYEIPESVAKRYLEKL